MAPMLESGYILRIFKRPCKKCCLGTNPNTDHISVHYHVIYDDMFTAEAATSDTDKIELWGGLHKTFPCPNIQGLFNQDTFNIKPSKITQIKSNTNEHPIQTKLRSYMTESKGDKKQQTKQDDTVISKGDPKEYDCSTNMTCPSSLKEFKLQENAKSHSSKHHQVKLHII
eukprot:7071442-Ditylum_brightwellii.AAC.1